MKKIIISSVMVPLLIFALVGCGSDNNADGVEVAYESEVAETGTETNGEEGLAETETDVTEEMTESEEATPGDESLISVVFTEDGSILSLGDEKAVFDDVLGESTENDGQVSYLDGTFTVRFEDGIATTIVATSFERVDFPAFDVDRTISALTRDLMFGDFIEHPSVDHAYLLPIDIDSQSYVFMVTLGLDNDELSHVESVALRVLEDE